MSLNDQQDIYSLYFSSVCLRENNVFYFGLRLEGRGLKTSIVGAIHEVLEEVWEFGYVGGDQQCQGIGCNLFMIYMNATID